MKLRTIKSSTAGGALSSRLDFFYQGGPTGKDREALAEARGRMLLVIRTRWILILLFCLYGLYAVSPFFCSQDAGTIEGARTASLAGSLLTAVIFNLFSHLLYRKLSHFPWANHLQILLDIIVVSVIIHHSGGIFSPFWPVYPIIAIEASMLLENKGDVGIMCCVASIVYGALVAAEYSGAVVPAAAPFTGGVPGSNSSYYLFMWFWVSALTAAMGSAGLMATGVTRRREDALKQLVVKDQMTNLYNRSYFFKELNSEIQRSMR